MTYDQRNSLQVNVDEVFVIPTGLRVVAILDGIELFGSDNLNRSFIKALTKSSRTKPVVDKIQSLVEKKEVIPCFLSKTILGFVARKFFTPRSGRATVAFFEPIKTKKIYVLIDNNVNFFAHVSNNYIAAVTVHELIHMSASRSPMSFFNLFKDELVVFYKNLWKTIFSLDEGKINDSEIQDLIRFVFRKLELKRGEITNSDLVRYYSLLGSTFSKVTTLDGETFDKKIREYIVTVKLFLRNFDVFYSIAKKFESIIGPIYVAYKRTFGFKNLNVFCIQELIYPSEVICICSEHGLRAKVTKTIKQI